MKRYVGAYYRGRAYSLKEFYIGILRNFTVEAHINFMCSEMANSMLIKLSSSSKTKASALH